MVKLGEVRLEGINVDPLQSTPGGTNQITAVISESAETLGPTGEFSVCDPGGGFFGSTEKGLQIEIVFTFPHIPDKAITYCMPVSLIDRIEKTEIAPIITVPENTGDYTIGAYLRSPKNGKTTESETANLTVSNGPAAKSEPVDLQKNETGNGLGLGGIQKAVSQNPTLAIGVVAGGIVITSIATR